MSLTVKFGHEELKKKKKIVVSQPTKKLVLTCTYMMYQEKPKYNKTAYPKDLFYEAIINRHFDLFKLAFFSFFFGKIKKNNKQASSLFCLTVFQFPIRFSTNLLPTKMVWGAWWKCLHEGSWYPTESTLHTRILSLPCTLRVIKVIWLQSYPNIAVTNIYDNLIISFHLLSILYCHLLLSSTCTKTLTLYMDRLPIGRGQCLLSFWTSYKMIISHFLSKLKGDVTDLLREIEKQLYLREHN